MKMLERRLHTWQIGLAGAIIAVMVKGFGWIGFYAKRRPGLDKKKIFHIFF